MKSTGYSSQGCDPFFFPGLPPSIAPMIAPMISFATPAVSINQQRQLFGVFRVLRLAYYPVVLKASG
jgi:hypothetical protein